MLGVVIAVSGVSAKAAPGKVDRFSWPTLGGLIMLAGIYYGAQYGG